MLEALIYLASSFWLGAVHAATPGHGKTIAAAYIVGVRGKPVDAWILGIFVTLSHTSGILLVGLLASLGLPGFLPQRMEAYLSLLTGLLVVAIGVWTLWTQRALIQQLRGPRAHSHDGMAAHTHDDGQEHTHEHGEGHANGDHHHHGEAGSHCHGLGFIHSPVMDLVTVNRPSLWVLIGLGVAGGLIPDPAALGILLNAVAHGKMMLGLGTVIVFSLGFAGTLVIVGIVAAKVGRKILDWLAGPWAIRMQLATSALIVVVGLVLTYQAWRMLAELA